ncbi:LysR family transcriptional regulator substrate-binding protein [Humibacter ginsenosidimutans]|uniref:LysR family transcriptional regulator substrate-binding protein n=2 Tax=Humibacter ginsenosidimutans TaxID=2599293 RepID=A0A5B8M921_9MICO|nr:LysR family transcriptional regulator substrate-binding protein [Humibacter ginsenosidimutans]
MPFRLAYVRGVTPAKWARIWGERMRRVPLDLVLVEQPDQERVLRGGEADMALVRLPIDRDGLHAIPLYEERAVVVVPKDHAIAAADEVTEAEVVELAGPVHPFDPAVDDALALVAAGVGSIVLPQSVARLHARRDLVARPVADAEPTRIALAWLSDPAPGRTDSEQYRIDTFIGIVRGRTANSSRG